MHGRNINTSVAVIACVSLPHLCETQCHCSELGTQLKDEDAHYIAASYGKHELRGVYEPGLPGSWSELRKGSGL